MSAPDLVVWVQAHCRECPWISADCRSQGDALAAHAAHQRQVHTEPWGLADE
jgi:hypothetical protein